MRARGREGKAFPSTHPKKRVDCEAKFIFHTKLFFLLTLLSFFFIFSFQTISADVVSVNSGGDNSLVIIPDERVEGFFSGIPEEAAPVTPPGGGGSTGGGGGGGGGAAAATLSLEPAILNVNLAVDTTAQRTINVTNTGGSTIFVMVSQESLDNHVILGNTTLIIQPGQTVALELVFVALSKPGIFTGKIVIGGQEVLVSLDVNSKLLLFDSNIVVLNPDLRVVQGTQLNTRVTLIPLGDPERLDVTLNFVIKDYANKVYLTRSETLLVTNITVLDRNFDTGMLSLGNYVVGLELIYPNGVAPSSAHFEVVRPAEKSIFGRLVLFLLLMIIIVIILIIIIILWKRRKKKKEEEQRKNTN